MSDPRPRTNIDVLDLTLSDSEQSDPAPSSPPRQPGRTLHIPTRVKPEPAPAAVRRAASSARIHDRRKATPSGSSQRFVQPAMSYSMAGPSLQQRGPCFTPHAKSERGTGSSSRPAASYSNMKPDPLHMDALIFSTTVDSIRPSLLELCATSPALAGAVMRGLQPALRTDHHIKTNMDELRNLIDGSNQDMLQGVVSTLCDMSPSFARALAQRLAPHSHWAKELVQVHRRKANMLDVKTPSMKAERKTPSSVPASSYDRHLQSARLSASIKDEPEWYSPSLSDSDEVQFLSARPTPFIKRRQARQNSYSSDSDALQVVSVRPTHSVGPNLSFSGNSRSRATPASTVKRERGQPFSPPENPPRLPFQRNVGALPAQPPSNPFVARGMPSQAGQKRKSETPTPPERCQRCSKTRSPGDASCKYHNGQKVKRRVENGQHVVTWSCCRQLVGALGCRDGVHDYATSASVQDEYLVPPASSFPGEFAPKHRRVL